VANGHARVETPAGRFVGVNADGLAEHDEAMLFVRPERIALAEGHPEIDNQLDAEVERRDLEGPFVNVFLRAGDRPVVMHLTNVGDAAGRLEGTQRIGFAAEDALVLRAGQLASE
jgi:spermidine/putrescine transport system ATP-binding protein